MSLHRICATAIALLSVTIAAATPGLRAESRHPAAVPGTAGLMAFGGRSAAQLASGIGGKLDAALAEIARHSGSARPGSVVADLRAMNPAAKFMQHGAGAAALVAVDAVTRGDPQQLKKALESLGLEHAAVFRNDVGGWLPVSAIESAAARAEVTSLRAAMSRTRSVVATQGDFAQGTAALRTALPVLDGTGVTVGILSDSYNCYGVYAANQGITVGGVPDPPAAGPTGYASNGFTADAATDVSSGALPSNVNVLEEAGGGGTNCITDFGYPYELPFADEGRAMLQIVYAVAPRANLAFYTADNSEADFANGIQALANAGAKVIGDDVGYFDEPFFQDGLVGEAIDTVEAAGVAYFSAAGNNANLAYDNLTPSFSIAGSGQQAGEQLLNFDASGASQVSTLDVSVPVLSQGEFVAVVVEWDQPYVTGSAGSPGASSQIDVCVTATVSYLVFNLDGTSETCTGPNATGSDPVQVLILGNPANATGNTAAGTVKVSVGLAGGAPPGRIKVAWEDDGAGSSITNFVPTTNATIQGHPNAAGAAAVGAAFFPDTPLCGTTPATLEFFSSLGGTPTLFDNSGNRLATPTVRLKPDFVAPDGVNTTFFGFQIAGTMFIDDSTVPECANNASLPNYLGTSAATPHAAALAALMLQANSTLTPAEIYQILRASAAPMSPPTPNYQSGYGFIQAVNAISTPALILGAGAIAVGNSTTLTWMVADATTCSASGAWSGAEALSGTKTITPSAAGTQTFALKCTGAAGSSINSATLTVNAALAITTSSLTSGQVGSAYSASLAASGGVAPYNWTLSGGTLPAGLTLDAATGALSGTPTTAVSDAALTFQVTDSESPAQKQTVSLMLTIAAAPPSSGGHGGGGALGDLTLLLLAGIALARVWLRRYASAMTSANTKPSRSTTSPRRT
jgi:subtilase family protein/putative Ig domain-containing protein